jgi:hypothetical protein
MMKILTSFERRITWCDPTMVRRRSHAAPCDFAHYNRLGLVAVTFAEMKHNYARGDPGESRAVKISHAEYKIPAA